MNIRLIFAWGIIGAVIGVALGFVVYTTGFNGHNGFIVWVTNPDYGRPSDALIWMMGGIIVGVAASYIRNRNSN